MPRLLCDGLLWMVVLGFPWLLARRRTGGNLASLVGVINLLAACSFVLLIPAAERLETAIIALGLLAIDLAAWFTPERLERRLLTMVRWPSAKIGLTVAMAGVVPLGLTELACRMLTGIPVLRSHQAIQTDGNDGLDDERALGIPPWPVVCCQRALIRYRAYLVLMHYARSWRAQPPAVAARGAIATAHPSPRITQGNPVATRR